MKDTQRTPEQEPDPYIELLKGALTGTIHQDVWALLPPYEGPRWKVHRQLNEGLRRALRMRGIEPVKRVARKASRDQPREGSVWPLVGETMIGLRRLESLQECMEAVLRRGVPGDFIETGVWRGGATIFMRGFLKSRGVDDRRVYVADSFEGLPAEDPRYPQDAGDRHHTFDQLAVGLDVVRENFDRYGLLDDQVRFLKGWFRDTLSTVADARWAVVRLDGDMYASTMDGLTALYPNLSVGGYLIVDDFELPNCRRAIEDYRHEHAITEPIETVDEMAIWQREH